MTSTVETWFGDAFCQLHPQLQSLHRHGGVLVGTVNVEFGQGLARLIGRRLARRLGVPSTAGPHSLQVSIYSADGTLHWNRSFETGTAFPSQFIPEGKFPEGRWVERSGRLHLLLGVRIVDGGWYWQQRGVRLGPISLPQRLLPRTLAFKRIVDGLYEFSVTVTVPLVGPVLHYSGILAPNPSIEGAASSGLRPPPAANHLKHQAS